MSPDPTLKKLKALPIQLIEITNGVILKRGCTEVKISGEGAAKVLRAVLAATANGGATREDICAAFTTPEQPTINQLIDHLVNRRLLAPSDAPRQVGGENRESHLDIFYWHFGEPASQVTERLNALRIAIIGVNCISRQLAASLAASGVENFQIVDAPLSRNLRLFDGAAKLKVQEWPSLLKCPVAYKEWASKVDPQHLDCLVATSDFGSTPALREWNQFCVERNRHFLPVVLHNLIGYVGPFVVPGETACFECLLSRQNSHMDNPDTQRAPEDVAFEGQWTVGFHPSMASILGDIAALELARFYANVLPMKKVGTLIEVNLLAMKLTNRKVLKIPRCPICSPLNVRSSTHPKKTVYVPGKRLTK